MVKVLVIHVDDLALGSLVDAVHDYVRVRDPRRKNNVDHDGFFSDAICDPGKHHPSGYLQR